MVQSLPGHLLETWPPSALKGNGSDAGPSGYIMLTVSHRTLPLLYQPGPGPAAVPVGLGRGQEHHHGHSSAGQCGLLQELCPGQGTAMLDACCTWEGQR